MRNEQEQLCIKSGCTEHCSEWSGCSVEFGLGLLVRLCLRTALLICKHMLITSEDRWLSSLSTSNVHENQQHSSTDACCSLFFDPPEVPLAYVIRALKPVAAPAPSADARMDRVALCPFKKKKLSPRRGLDLRSARWTHLVLCHLIFRAVKGWTWILQSSSKLASGIALPIRRVVRQGSYVMQEC